MLMHEIPQTAMLSANHNRLLGRSFPLSQPTKASTSGVAVTSVVEAATLVSIKDQTQAPKWTA